MLAVALEMGLATVLMRVPDPGAAVAIAFQTMAAGPARRGKRWGVLPDYHRRGVAPLEHPLPPLLRLLVDRMRTRVGLGLLRVRVRARVAVPEALICGTLCRGALR